MIKTDAAKVMKSHFAIKSYPECVFKGTKSERTH